MKYCLHLLLLPIILCLHGCQQKQTIDYLEALAGDWHHCEQVPEIEGYAMSLRWHFRDDGSFSHVKAGSTTADCQSIIVFESYSGHYELNQILTKNEDQKKAVLSLEITRSLFKKRSSSEDTWEVFDPMMEIETNMRKVAIVDNQDRLFVIDLAQIPSPDTKKPYSRFNESVVEFTGDESNFAAN